jgi:hypothetical protein
VNWLHGLEFRFESRKLSSNLRLWFTSTLKVFERRGDLQEWGRQLSAAISLVDESRESQTLCKFLLDVVWASR